MKANMYLFIITLFILTSCKKERLEGELEVFRGKFKWEGYHARNCELCQVVYYSSSNEGFSAEIEFDNSGKVTFIIDNEVYIQKKFKITNKDQISSDWQQIEIKVDVPKSKLDINDKLSLNIKGDTLTIDKYPIPGYETTTKFPLGNTFVRE